MGAKPAKTQVSVCVWIRHCSAPFPLAFMLYVTEAATPPPAHFHRNPPGGASFGRLLCRSSSQNTQQRHYTSH
jgi:hypothetical protein